MPDEPTTKPLPPKDSDEELSGLSQEEFSEALEQLEEDAKSDPKLKSIGTASTEIITNPHPEDA